MNTEHPNAALLRNTFEAIGRGDVDAFWSTQSDRVTALVETSGPFGGEFKGKGRSDWIPCGIFGKLSEHYTQPLAGQGRGGAPGEPAPIRGGGIALVTRLESVVADDNKGAVIYSYPSRQGEVVGVVVVQFEEGQIVKAWHHDPLVQSHDGLRFLIAGS